MKNWPGTLVVDISVGPFFALTQPVIQANIPDIYHSSLQLMQRQRVREQRRAAAAGQSWKPVGHGLPDFCEMGPEGLHHAVLRRADVPWDGAACAFECGPSGPDRCGVVGWHGRAAVHTHARLWRIPREG